MYSSLITRSLFKGKKTRSSSRNQIYTVYFYLFGVLRRFQHCTGHITTGNWKGRGNQYIQFVRVLYCKLPTNSKQLPAFPLEAVPGIESRPQRWEARVLPLCHHGPSNIYRGNCTEQCDLRIRYHCELQLDQELSCLDLCHNTSRKYEIIIIATLK